MSDSSADGILQALSSSNGGNFPVLARHFVKRWCKALNAETSAESITAADARFRTSLSGFYLRGFEDPWAVMFPAWREQTRASLLESLRAFSSAMPLVLCSVERQFAEIMDLLPPGRAAVLPPGVVGRVLSGGADSREVLRKTIREQFPLLRLQPYDTTHPVCGEIFTGRAQELSLLLNQERDSFLITGPSKIGKTSLLYHYRWLLQRASHPRLSKSFHINLQPCLGLTEDEIARYFAIHFRDMPYTSGQLTFRELRSFLYSVLPRTGDAIEIILDEVDAVCHTNLLITVAEFAASSRSRLIAVGRGRVRRFRRENQATAFGRLRDMRFQALSPDETWLLFRQPIEGLGLTIEAPDEMRELLLRQTSRMPHLVQACARYVIELASGQNTRVVTLGMLRRSQDSFSDYSVLRTHLDDLFSDQSRLAAIAVLTQPRKGVFTTERIQEALAELGVHVGVSDTADLCDDLVINGLLTWEHSGYAPPRWDIYETARHHLKYLLAVQQECLARLRARTT